MLSTLLVPAFVGEATSNLAWIAVTKAVLAGDANQAQQDMPEYLFATKNRLAPSSDNDFFGLGIAHVLANEHAEAERIWQEKSVPASRLIGIGDWYRQHNDWQEALFYYTAASRLQENSDADLHILEVCRKLYELPIVLDEASQHICVDYRYALDRNLVIDGDFGGQGLDFWERHYVDGVNYWIDSSFGMPAPSLRIDSSTDRYIGGVFQQLSLPPGTVVKFSAWLRVQAVEDVRVHPVYTRGVQGDKLVVRTKATIKDSMEWQYIERTFRIPATDDGQLSFYPAFLGGTGVFWIDNVRLRVLDE